MQSPYKSNNPTRPQTSSNLRSANSSQSQHDLKGPRMTSREPIKNKRSNLKSCDTSDKANHGSVFLNKFFQTH